jgi:hypothetical protein
MALPIPAEAPVTMITSLDLDIFGLKVSKIVKKQKARLSA